MKHETIRIALIGAGGMGFHQSGVFSKLDGCEIVAICDVDQKRAMKAAANTGSDPTIYTELDALFENEDFDAVTNCTPDRFHHPVALKALSEGKHILSEKPLAMNHEQAAEMVDAADSAGTINMVNLSYRDAPAIQKAKSIIESGEIGNIVHLNASYFQTWLSGNVWGDWREDPTWLWRLSTEHGSQGTLGDIGVHILDFASYPVGGYRSVRCELRTFDKAPGGRIGDYVLDANDTFAATAEFENGAFGVIQASRWASGYRNRVALTVFGEKGSVRVDLDADRHSVDVCSGKDLHTASWRTVEAEPTPNNYERFLESIRTGINDQPDFERGAEIQKVLDSCFESNETGETISLVSDASAPRTPDPGPRTSA